jgi:hypothetical protein
MFRPLVGAAAFTEYLETPVFLTAKDSRDG